MIRSMVNSRPKVRGDVFSVKWKMHGADNGVTGIIRDHWDRRARTFDDEAGHGLLSEDQRRAWLDLLSLFSGKPPQRVLDVGCGTGFLALRFAELGHTVTGTDLSPEMIDRACRKAEQAGLELDFRVGNASALDGPDEMYDIVAARHVLWNLPDPERGVAEWLRVLRPGGRLILIEGKWAHDDESTTTKARHRAPFTEGVKDAIVEISLHSGIGAKRFLRRRYRRVERELPFSGGPSVHHVVKLLERLSVSNIGVEPLMNPALWGEPPPFPRYLISGSRSD
jgi:ubiquinone/menaquinone biosynthesis C-methylase UbiE